MGCQSSQQRYLTYKIREPKQEWGSIKLVLHGDARVGKTSMKYYYKQGVFSQIYAITHNSEYFQKRVTASTGQIIRVDIWDTCSREKYQSMMPFYFRNAKIIIVAFDLTNYGSFAKVDYYISKIKQIIQTSNVILCLVGNKSDLSKQRVVFKEEGQKKARQLTNSFYHQTSAVTGEGINSLFQKAVDQLANIRRRSLK